ncbi:S1 RNA-binding domain-containing protein [Candidatus Bipolaricaulota bacterium]|nr:S1 RNA-binding domain-containing protein [Candidatus Bipolaricaulota bacterium]
MVLEIGRVVTGEITEQDASNLRVRLPNGQIAVVAESDPSSDLCDLQVGYRVRVRVLAYDAEQQARVLLLSAHQPQDDDLFDQRFTELNRALTSHAPCAQPQHDRDCAPREPFIEERLKQWMQKADSDLSRLRKHRSKRLSKELYPKGEDEGRHAKRNGSN